MREPPRKQFNWTKEVEDRLVQLIEQDRVSAARAAAILNSEFPDRNPLTRSAVVGKINRMWKGIRHD